MGKTIRQMVPNHEAHWFGIYGKVARTVEKDLGYIRNAADKMGFLLDEIRRLSRIGRITNPSEEAPLQAIVKEALDPVAGRITARGVRVDLTEEAVVLYGDRTRLAEVFMNLVDNAVKFMGDEPAPRTFRFTLAKTRRRRAEEAPPKPPGGAR